MSRKASIPDSDTGPLMCGEALWRALGYRTRSAFNQAARCGRVGIPLFDIPGRKGKHARRADVQKWLSDLDRTIGSSPLGTSKEIKDDVAPS